MNTKIVFILEKVGSERVGFQNFYLTFYFYKKKFLRNIFILGSLTDNIKTKTFFLPVKIGSERVKFQNYTLTFKFLKIISQ